MSNLTGWLVGLLSLTAMIAIAADVPVPAQSGEMFTCPMHPQLRWPKADKCPLCSMPLQKVSTESASMPAKSLPSVLNAPQHQVHMANQAPMPGMSGSHEATGDMDGMCPHCAKGMNMPTNGATSGSQMPGMNCHSPTASPVSSPKAGGSSGGRRGCGC